MNRRQLIAQLINEGEMDDEVIIVDSRERILGELPEEHAQIRGAATEELETETQVDKQFAVLYVDRLLLVEDEDDN